LSNKCSIQGSYPLETKLIAKALQETAGNRLKAANLLGITRQGLYKKMSRYQIED
jgi:DNA-binding NtrC family response regulator